MKKLLIIAFVLFATNVFANPFLICDPQAGVTNYKLTGVAWGITEVEAQPDGSILMDVADSPIGENSITLKACKEDSVWGEVCSASVPFVYTRPVPPAITSGIRLIQ